MLSTITLSLSLLAGVTSARFHVPSLTTHQPNGSQNDIDYRIAFNVTSDNANSTGEIVHCSASWNDNDCAAGNDCVATSTNVPTQSWLPCDTKEYAFHLYPNFAIGNFSLELQQTTQDGLVKTSAPRQITNATFTITSSDYDEMTCNIVDGPNASGDCTSVVSPYSNDVGFYIDVASLEGQCADPDQAAVSFTVAVPTKWYDHVFVVGNLPELGNWDPYNAVALSGDGWSENRQLWNGETITLPVGSEFEYKYIVWTAAGKLVWECGNNRPYTVIAANTTALACGTQVPQNGYDRFSCSEQLNVQPTNGTFVKR